MDFSIISFTENGITLSKEIAGKLENTEKESRPDYGQVSLYTKCTGCPDSARNQTILFVKKGIGEWAKEQFEKKNAMVFIGACGIAVRAIAPYITDKLHDSPVLVMDEKGHYVIPLLSGHMGGANELAVFLAKEIGAEPVITTATDINKKFAVDLFAKKNGLSIVNRDGIAGVSSKVLAGQEIIVSVETGHFEENSKMPQGIRMTEYPPLQKADIVITSEEKEFDTVILLRPKEYVIGMGCRKGKEAEKIEEFVACHLQKAGISLMQVVGLASIDVKKEEPGLLAWSRKEKLPFITYTAEELQCVKGDFHRSDFVKNRVGVDNVCERAALKAAGTEGRLVYEKHAEDGMTLAIAQKKWSVSFHEA